jgi:hypothetical protein
VAMSSLSAPPLLLVSRVRKWRWPTATRWPAPEDDAVGTGGTGPRVSVGRAGREPGGVCLGLGGAG